MSTNAAAGAGAAGAAGDGGAGGAAGAAGGQADWLASLDAGTRQHIEAKGYKTPADLAKAYVGAEALIGQKRLVAPQKDWGDEQYLALYKELGMPDTPDKYPVPEIKPPEGVKLDDDLKEVRQLAHKMGLTPKQAKILQEEYANRAIKGHELESSQQKQSLAQAEAAIAEKFGDKLEGARGLVSAVLKQHAPEGFAEQLEAAGLANNPAVFEMLHNMGKLLMEDSSRGGAALNVPQTTKAMAEIESLMQDPKFLGVYANGSAPGHAAAVERVNRLRSIAYPGQTQLA